MRVLVYGGSDRTGARVADALTRAGHVVVLGGRRRAALVGLAQRLGLGIRVAAVEDRRALRDALRGLDVVVQCAALDVSGCARVVGAALAEAVHYVDVTAEAEIVEGSSAHADAAARARGLCVCTGMAPVGGALGEWMARALVRSCGVEPHTVDVAVGYVAERLSSAAGSRASSQRLRAGIGPWQLMRARVFEFPPPFGLGPALPLRLGDQLALRRAGFGSARSYATIMPRCYEASSPGPDRGDGRARARTPRAGRESAGLLLGRRAGRRGRGPRSARARARSAVVSQAPVSVWQLCLGRLGPWPHRGDRQ